MINDFHVDDYDMLVLECIRDIDLCYQSIPLLGSSWVGHQQIQQLLNDYVRFIEHIK